jgi:hypothetical protein
VSTLKVNNVEDLGADAVVTNGVIEKAALPSGSILQVLQTVQPLEFSTTSASYVEVTGVTATITPRAVSSKILVICDGIASSTSGVSAVFLQLFRGATGLTGSSSLQYYNDASAGGSFSITFLDSPSTASSITYGLRAQVSSGITARVGDIGNGALELPTRITVMEVAG